MLGCRWNLFTYPVLICNEDKGEYLCHYLHLRQANITVHYFVFPSVVVDLLYN